MRLRPVEHYLVWCVDKNVLEAPAVRRYTLHENVSNDITHFTHPNRLQLSSVEC